VRQFNYSGSVCEGSQTTYFEVIKYSLTHIWCKGKEKYTNPSKVFALTLSCTSCKQIGALYQWYLQLNISSNARILPFVFRME